MAALLTFLAALLARTLQQSLGLCCVVKAIFTTDLAPRFWPDAGSAS